MIITNHKNGNCQIEIHDDGTKIRRWDGVASPQFPESIDLKITNYCYFGCMYCHESCTTHGQHASLASICRIIDGLPAGTEIAVGGGDTMSHPDLLEILRIMKDRGLIANMTVNCGRCALSSKLWSDISNEGLIHGMGVSLSTAYVEQIFRLPFSNKNMVIHVIAGIHSLNTVAKLIYMGYKVLVLGYKRSGRGASLSEEALTRIDKKIDAWKHWIRTILRNSKNIISFDALAIKQLNLKDQIDDEKTWNYVFMGNDGHFTMYVDAVSMQYAISSTHKRIPIKKLSIEQMFADVRSRALVK